MNSNRISVIVGGDFVPTGNGIGLFEAGDAEGLVGCELLDAIYSADFSVFNLEVPLVDVISPIPKCGPNLLAPTGAVVGLAAINPGAFSLANNHILDQGYTGLSSTIKLLDAVGAVHFGAGANLERAAKPYIFEKNGIKIGFYACAEHEFSIATDIFPGANPFDPLESLDHIAALKAKCNYVVVLLHGGKEYYCFPSPLLQKTCRKIAEKGADLVICQHSHCIGCEEKWGTSTIVYGQGNFLFDHSESEFWQTGLLIRVSFNDENMSVDYLPLRKTNMGVRMAKDDDAQRILEGFRQRSEAIKNPIFVKEEYSRFAASLLDSYLATFVPGSHFFTIRALNKVMRHGLFRKLTNSHRCLAALNIVECEAHRELFSAGLKDLYS